MIMILINAKLDSLNSGSIFANNFTHFFQPISGLFHAPSILSELDYFTLQIPQFLNKFLENFGEFSLIFANKFPQKEGKKTI